MRYGIKVEETIWSYIYLDAEDENEAIKKASEQFFIDESIKMCNRKVEFSVEANDD